MYGHNPELRKKLKPKLQTDTETETTIPFVSQDADAVGQREASRVGDPHGRPPDHGGVLGRQHVRGDQGVGPPACV